MPIPASTPSPGLLDHLAALTTYAIAAAAAVHLFVFWVLSWWARRDLKNMASALREFTRGLSHQSVLDTTSHLSDQVDAFIADVNDVLDAPTRREDRASLLKRMSILDERRRYLQSMLFETVYNIARTMIEAYPLAGILGTIVAIGAALQATSSVDVIVQRFGDAIWSTGAGLIAFIVLLFLNSFLEPAFLRLAENREHVRGMIARAKRELSLMSSGSAGGDA